MESMTTGPGPINSLPSPPMEGKSPPSRASSGHGEARGLDSPHEEASKMTEDRRHQQTPSPAHSAAHSASHSPSLNHHRPKSEHDQSPSADDYQKGLVHCGTCGEGVPFKDPQSGGFTLRLWDMHRDQCRSRHEPQPEPIVFTPETTVDSMANPPIKKRRAKRTEEERIEYLRTDPFVAQFEPYRVLCGSCNKWIRLRPNSTYCSIPWDAHRKSCLAKKAGTIPVDHRSPESNGTTAGAGRQLPSVAAITGNSNVHMSAVNGHSSANGGVHPPANRLHSSLAPAPPMLSSKSRAPAPSLGSLPAPAPFARSGAGSPYATPTSMASGSYASGPDTSPSSALHELVTVTGMIDSRRKNAEQRAAALRADPFIREVQPNRVFCGLCGKWVQLRQDSSFCAYPWHQHRSKCLARYERRQEKARIYAYASASRRGYDGADYDHYGPGADLDEDGSFDDELDSEDDRPLPRRHSPEAYSADEDSRRYPYPKHHSPPEYAYRQRSGSHPYAHSRPPALPALSYSIHSPSHANSTSGRYKLSPQAASLASHHRAAAAAAPSYTLRRAHSAEEIDDVSMDEDGGLGRDADIDMEDGDREREYRARLDHVRRPSREYSYTRNHHHSSRLSALADLRSASGRLAFIAASVEHLFRTTYDRGDELSVVSLINYLNAAMPADKHDDFDVQEVTRAAASLAKTGALVLEGDRLRPRD